MRKAMKSTKVATKKQESVDSATSTTNIVVATVEVSSTESTDKTPLTLAETKLLAECEEIIGKGLKAGKRQLKFSSDDD